MPNKGKKLIADHLRKVQAPWTLPKPIVEKVARLAEYEGIPKSQYVAKVLGPLIDELERIQITRNTQ